MPIIDLSVIRFAPVRNGSDLDMADCSHMRLQPMRQVALHDLEVIAVEHQFEIISAHFSDDVQRLIGSLEEVAGASR